MMIEHYCLSSSFDPSVLRVFLHGLGSCGENLQFLYDTLPQDHLIALFPTAPSLPVTMNQGYSMPAWFDIESIPHFSKKMLLELDNTVTSLVHLIDDVRSEYPSIKYVDVIGFSQGGVVALALSKVIPVRYLGLLSTFYPLEDVLNPKVEKVFIAHGQNDPIVPYDLGKSIYQRLGSLKLSIDFKTYPLIGHSISMAVVRDLRNFLEQ
jgi:phospholipase/carboxylesterase